jgi:predicted RND superfamily exporter protein
MGVVIVGGTIFSLVLTLFVIPALYFMWSELKHTLNLNTLKNMKTVKNKMKIVNHKIKFYKSVCFFACKLRPKKF